ncbi:MAG: hypothetical protein LBD11_04025 [Candidatus Peribacteria bacterium]|jgi:hypothetical protein|nr:hypothetical protein [Candidatus Peribacteria bacterium]
MEIIKEKSTTTSITPKLVDSDLTSTLSASEKIKQIGIIEDEQGRKFDITVKVVDEKGKIIAGYPDLMMLVNNEHPRYYTRSSGRLILEGD